jgi:hypothetical protein
MWTIKLNHVWYHRVPRFQMCTLTVTPTEFESLFTGSAPFTGRAPGRPGTERPLLSPGHTTSHCIRPPPPRRYRGHVSGRDLPVWLPSPSNSRCQSSCPLPVPPNVTAWATAWRHSDWAGTGTQAPNGTGSQRPEHCPGHVSWSEASPGPGHYHLCLPVTVTVTLTRDSGSERLSSAYSESDSWLHLEGCLMVYTTFGWYIPCSNWYIPHGIYHAAIGIYHMVYTIWFIPWYMAWYIWVVYT